MKAATFRLSLCAFLIVGITARPYTPLEKLTYETQETVSKHDTKKMHVGVEPKEMDAGVNTWKNMASEQYEAPLKAEEVWEEVDVVPLYNEPEQDWDEVYHKDNEKLIPFLAPLRDDYKADTEVRVVRPEPEKDKEVYHRDVRVYLQPEVDKDDLYHKDVGQLFQSDPKAAAPVELPAQRKHREPEEDLDDLYHQ